MKRFLQHRSNRWTHDGWCLRVVGASSPLEHTACTTRAEVREIHREMTARSPDLFRKMEIVKVKISLEVVE